MFYIRRGEAPATAFLLCERRETSGFACGRVPFRSCEKEPKARLGRKRGFDVERKGRVLAHSVFPLRTPRRERFCGNAETADAARLQRGISPPLKNPQPCGADERIPTFIDRRRLNRHAKPLIPAAAPMVVVKDFRAVGQRLRRKFACCCGGANEHKPHKASPAQRQRKENDSVLTK